MDLEPERKLGPRSKRKVVPTTLGTYETLARSICLKLAIHDEPMRTSKVLLGLQSAGLKLQDLEQAVFAPRVIVGLRKLPRLMTLPAVQRRFLIPFLVALRGDKTLAEAAEKTQIKTLSTYHHWESGRRDIPFDQFLRTIDALSGRLSSFLESLPFEIPYTDIGLTQIQPGQYHQFFNAPWTPTLFLALRLPAIKKLKTASDQVEELSKNLQITAAEIESSLSVLLNLRLVRFEKGVFVADPRQLYAIPSLSQKKIDEIHRYWFSKSIDFLKLSGFHKVEQHAVSVESKDKIIVWISELRERIRNEVKNSGEPEALIHINWQLAELL